MDKREKLIERIKKLLAVTEERGATESEAPAAALAAQRLMAENDVAESELGGDGDEEIRVEEARKTRAWQSWLAVAVADNFRCKCFQRSRFASPRSTRRTYSAAFFGYESDAAAARLVFEKLSKVGHRLADAHSKRRERELGCEGVKGVRAGLYNEYASGFVAGVRDVLEKQSVALMIVCPPAVSDAYEERRKGFTPGRRSRVSLVADGETREAGRQAGRDAVMAGRDAVMAGRVGQSDSSFLLAG